MEFFSNTQIDFYIIETFAINLAIGLSITGLLLYIFKDKDPLILASFVISYAIISSATAELELAQNVKDEVTLFMILSSLAIIIIIISSFIMVKIPQIRDQNLNLYHCINIIALSIILRSIIIWVDFVSLEGLLILISIYIVDLSIYLWISNKIKEHIILKSLGNNIGLALTMAGSLIFVPYDVIDIGHIMIYHIIYNIAFSLIFILLAKLIDLFVNKIYLNELSRYTISSSLKLFIAIGFANLI